MYLIQKMEITYISDILGGEKKWYKSLAAVYALQAESNVLQLLTESRKLRVQIRVEYVRTRDIFVLF
jgi:hypothetical protein